MKTCTLCNRRQPLSEYSPDRRTRNGLQARCKSCRREQMAAHRLTHPGYSATIGATYFRRHRERVNARNRAYAAAHPEQRAAALRAWAQANPDKIRENNRRWRESHRDLCRFYRNTWGHRIRANQETSDVTPEAWAGRVAEFGSRCAYCAKPLDRPHMDHIDPVSRGGTHTMDNIVPACKPCNSRKKDRPLLLALLAQRRVA